VLLLLLLPWLPARRAALWTARPAPGLLLLLLLLLLVGPSSSKQALTQLLAVYRLLQKHQELQLVVVAVGACRHGRALGSSSSSKIGADGRSRRSHWFSSSSSTRAWLGSLH
jgi:hypothetical protein